MDLIAWYHGKRFKSFQAAKFLDAVKGRLRHDIMIIILYIKH